MKHLPETYARRLARLRPFINTGIRARKNFTGAEKAKITKWWNRYAEKVREVEKGNAVFKKVNKLQRRALSDRFGTNSGIFIDGPVEYAKVRGRGKKTTVEIAFKAKPRRKRRRRQVYIQFPSVAVDKAEYISDLIDIYKPDQVAVAIKGYAGVNLYQPEFFEAVYVDQFIQRMGLKDVGDAFTGVYLIFNDKVDPP